MRRKVGDNTEVFSAEEFIKKVEKEEGKFNGYVLTPAGEKAISDHIIEQEAKILELENRIKDGCR